MKYSIFQRLKFSIITKQLRKPGGLLSKKVSDKMNELNEVVFDITVDAMDLKDNNAVMEIGFASGKFFEKLFSKAKNLKVCGIDFSKPMVTLAGKNNQSLIKEGKLNLQFGNSESLPFADNSFDSVFCVNVIYFWDQPEKHLKEVYRVLKPNGKFFASLRSKESFKDFPVDEYGFTLYNEDEWKTVLGKNNFTLAGVTKKKETNPNSYDNLIQAEIFCFMAEKNV